MIYFVTGASGFIGKRLVCQLLSQPDASVYFLMRASSEHKLDRLWKFWGAGAARAIPIWGDLCKAGLGVSDEQRQSLDGKIEHFFHLAAVYDLDADADEARRANVEGARNVCAFASTIRARRLHHISSIAAGGLYPGVFREDMFSEAVGLDHPYFATKHEGEGIVRTECKIPWRIYRPGMVVGDSTTGEMDKVDGPYYFFKLIQRLRMSMPHWMPGVGIEGGDIDIVPVDFVVAALKHISHLDGLDRQCFHLTSGRTLRVGDVMNIFAHAAHAPDMTIRISASLFDFIPRGIVDSLMALTPVRRIREAIMDDLGLPDTILQLVNYPTRFDCREAERLLRPAGIAPPPLEQYAWRLWDYWERHLDPDLFVDRSLKGRVAGHVAVVTGGSSGIGKATAFKIAAAGAKTIIVARDTEKLAATKQEAERQGLSLITYAADITEAANCEALVEWAIKNHGGVDILVNNAGRSIRRSIENSYDRFHDFDRNMQVNYFGSLRLTLGLLPHMARRERGHVIYISSIGVLTNAPRFSAYVASKAAFEAWMRCAASEFLDRGVEFTTINLPLVRTPMIAPTKFYEHVPALTPDQAADLVVDAVIRQPVRIATLLGIFGQIVHALSPRIAQIIMNTAFRMFPESRAADGERADAATATADQAAFAQLLRGVHF